jgi:class 3 adenylate cyclase
MIAVWLGGAVTLAAAGAERLGAFTAWERRSIDFRYVTAPRARSPMTSEIAHVDIDQSAVQSVGRWPWDRSTIADVIDELRKAGAKTIAIDLLLSSPQRDASGDEQFAAALERVQCLLAVNVGAGASPVDARVSDDETADLLEVLQRDVQIEPLAALDAADVRGRSRSAFRRKSIEYKRAAAWEVLQGEPAVPPFEEFERRMTPSRPATIDAYPERKPLRDVWEQARSWEAVRPMLVDPVTKGDFRDRAPLRIFAEAAKAVGNVRAEAEQHPDGVVREVKVKRPAPGGEVLQFGVAAAALHRGAVPQQADITDDAIRSGDVVIPLREGRMWINWPTSETEVRWEGMLRQRESDPATEGHISIGALVSIAEMRRAHERNLARRDAAAAAILQDEIPPGGLTDDHIREVEDEIEFQLGDLDPDEELTPEDEAFFAPFFAWPTLQEEIPAGQGRIDAATRELRRQVEDRLVFIGWTATGALADFVPTPIGARTPGVVVHAAVANMLLTGSTVRFPPDGVTPLLVLLLGSICTLAAARFATVPSALLAGGTLGAYVVITAWLYSSRGIIMPAVAPLLGSASAWIVGTAFQAAVSQRERARITQQFRARVSAQLVDHLVNNPEAVTVTGEQREMTVLFGDLAGFTTISEQLGGATTVSTLNRYMSELTDVLVARGAYLNKFLGDGLMAFWSAFAVDPDQARKACQAALNCQNAVVLLNDDPEYEDIPRLGLRLGIATGEVVVGDCGAPPALNDYTVIGDAVNLAARLESANKQFGTRILVNGRTRELLGDAEILVRPLGRIVVVGQSTPVEIFEVMPPETSPELIELSEKAASAFEAGKVEETRAVLEQLDARFGASPITELYREAMDEDDFDGVLHLREK